MNPKETQSTNIWLGKPKNWTAEMGECIQLPATRLEGTEGIRYESQWVPSEQERLAIFNGAPVILSIFSAAHPPVWVGVEGVAEPEPVLPKTQVPDKNGFLHCTPSTPMPADRDQMGQRWLHVNVWKMGTSTATHEHYKCRVCGTQFTQEVPE